MIFADDLTLLANSIEEATHQLESFYGVAATTGLRINLQKAEFMINIKGALSNLTGGHHHE